MNSLTLKLANLFVALTLAGLAAAQNASTAGPNSVPPMISYAGVLRDSAGKMAASTTGVTFLIYKDEQGGAPLWLETQSVAPDKTGHFTVQLGASSAHGLPPDLFQSGEARWLAVQIAGEAEQARVLLVAVPYAMKAADAQTLGGLPASAFVLAAPPNGGGSTTITESATSASSTPPPPASAVTTNGGIANTLPLFSTGTDIENSAISQTGSGTTAKIGIGTTAPVATLDVKGGATVRGVLSLPATGTATATAGKNSQPESLVASAFNSSTSAAVNQTFQWKAEPANNNTANPSAVLSLLYGSGTTAAADTGLRIGPKGIIGFAPGQTFPGAGGGTVTSVGLSAPASDFTVTGSPVTSSGTLGLNWTVAPDTNNTANAIVKRDAFGGFSSGSIFAVAASGSGGVGVSGYSDSNYGVAGQSGNGPGVYGTSALTNGVGIFGWAQHSGDGIDGTSASGRGMYGSVKQGQGVMGESFGTTTVNSFGPDGVVGLSHNALGHGVYAQNYDPNGVGLLAQGGSAGIVAIGTNGPAIQATGNVQQDRTSGGLVKAMVYVNGWTAPYNIIQCYNSTLTGAAATTPPCGIVFTEEVFGHWDFDFGFRVDDRFIVASLANTLASDFPVQVVAGATDPAPSNVVRVVVFKDSNVTGADAIFTLLVY